MHRLPIAGGCPDACGAVAARRRRGVRERWLEATSKIVGRCPGGPSNVRTRRADFVSTRSRRRQTQQSQSNDPFGLNAARFTRRRVIEQRRNGRPSAAKDSCPALAGDDESVQPWSGASRSACRPERAGTVTTASPSGSVRDCQRSVAQRSTRAPPRTSSERRVAPPRRTRPAVFPSDEPHPTIGSTTAASAPIRQCGEVADGRVRAARPCARATRAERPPEHVLRSALQARVAPRCAASASPSSGSRSAAARIAFASSSRAFAESAPRVRGERLLARLGPLRERPHGKRRVCPRARRARRPPRARRAGAAAARPRAPPRVPARPRAGAPREHGRREHVVEDLVRGGAAAGWDGRRIRCSSVASTGSERLGTSQA